MKNLVILIGRIAAAPETRQSGETSITSFTLVTDRPKIVDGKAVKNDKGYTETLAEFRKLTLGPELSAALDHAIARLSPTAALIVVSGPRAIDLAAA